MKTQQMKKRLSVILAAVTLCAGILLPTTARAESMADSAYDYEWGNTYSFRGNYTRYYKLTLSEKSLLYAEVTFDYNNTGGGEVDVYNTSGKTVINKDDFKGTYSCNAVTGISTESVNRVLPAGSYYVGIHDGAAKNFTFFATSEPAISLSTPKITSLKNSASKKMSVTTSSVGNATGYEYQYALKKTFSGKKTVDDIDTATTISGLTKGKTYYVRVRAYAVYGSGAVVRSSWSMVKAVKIKK